MNIQSDQINCSLLLSDGCEVTYRALVFSSQFILWLISSVYVSMIGSLAHRVIGSLAHCDWFFGLPHDWFSCSL